MTNPVFYIQYNENHGADPVTCDIGTAKELRIGDDLGERLPGNHFEKFVDFLATNDRSPEEWWIESRPLFLARLEKAKKDHAEWVARDKAAKAKNR